jgi:hypothetical protein
MQARKNSLSAAIFHKLLLAILILAVVFIFNGCNAKTVAVNSDGTFNPATVSIKSGEAVAWTGLTRTDSIVEIADPNGADPCAMDNAALPHQYNGDDPNEFSGPQRQAVSGIFALGPNEGGFVQKPLTDACLCERPALPDRLECAVNPPPLSEINKLDTVVSILDGNSYKLCPEEAAPHQALDMTWANPDITGVTVRLNWDSIQVDDHGTIEFYWDDLDREMNAAVLHGKPFVLDIRAGMNTPDWVFTDHSPPGPVTPVANLKDWSGNDSAAPTTNCGYPDIKIGSPADPVYRDLYVAMIGEVAKHISSDSRWFQALAHVKVSGANFVTSEARLPNRCNDEEDIDGDHKPDGNGTLDNIGADRCVCNTKLWADAGYTPAGLYEFYRVVGNEIYRDFFKRKSLGYQLIQDGFPRTIGPHNFMGDTLVDQDGIPMVSPSATPAPTKDDDLRAFTQTETVLQEGREGRFTDPFGGARDEVEGKLFIPQHSGLRRLPEDDLFAACSQHLIVDALGNVNFPILPGTPGDVDNDRDGDGDLDTGCPNRWAVDEGTVHSQVMGFQTNNAKTVNKPADVESTLWNLTINSNGVFIELYEERLWEINHQFGTGSTAPVLDPGRTALLPPNPAPFSKNLFSWGEILHGRRKILTDLNNPHLADPFPEIYVFAFPKPVPAAETHFYVNPSKCSLTASADRVGKIIISP